MRADEAHSIDLVECFRERAISDQVTLSVTRLDEPDDLIDQVLLHLSRQEGASGEILFVEQKPDSSIEAPRYSNSDWTCRILNVQAEGLSAARNLSIRNARNDIVLFCDADALAAPGWAAALARALSQGSTAVAGSRILPRWSGRRPVLAHAKVVLDQYSIFDLGPDSFVTNRVVGAGFGLDRGKCVEEMYFDETLGRRDGRLFGGEESDLCRRVRTAGGTVVYVGEAEVEHVIQAERLRTGWILKRLFYAGYGRASVGGTPAPSHRPGLADWLLLPLILPPYALGWTYGKLTR